jgi:hypothetical protein
MSAYPRQERTARGQIFAHRVTRLLFKSCATQRLGHHAALLVVHIVHTEDAARYSGPVTFWNSQLMETLGFSSPKQLTNARAMAVDQGWLHYERDGTRSVGNYWVTIPSNVASFDDTPIEQPQRIVSPGGTNPGVNHSQQGTNPGTNPGKPLIPLPLPFPQEDGDAYASLHTPESSSKTKRARREPFKPPTVEEVASYCKTRGNSVNPDAFVNHYASIGWKVGKNPMVDWQAAVRKWESADKETAKPAPAPHKAERPQKSARFSNPEVTQ